MAEKAKTQTIRNNSLDFLRLSPYNIFKRSNSAVSCAIHAMAYARKDDDAHGQAHIIGG
jgi:hypothetical protein